MVVGLYAPGPVARAQTPSRLGAVQLGAALNDGGFDATDARYRATFRDNFGAVTPESAFKMTETEPSRGHYAFGLQDRMLDWAEANGKQFHGHTLVWCADEWNPTWLTQTQWTPAELTAVLQDYISTVVGRYAGRVKTWDVVNEAFNANGTRRDCVWSRVLGPGYIETALRMAHEADPAAKLFYNEYNADLVNSRFRAVEAMAKDFRARGVPLDGIGLQMHLFGPSPPQYRIEEAMARIASLGLSVHVSELDDKTSSFPPAATLRPSSPARPRPTRLSPPPARPSRPASGSPPGGSPTRGPSAAPRSSPSRGMRTTRRSRRGTRSDGR